MIPARIINYLLRRWGWELRPGRSVTLPPSLSNGSGLPYEENPEAGPVNWSEKASRVAAGGPFEWPNMVALNKAAVSLLGESKKIGEIGGGTGCFAWEASSDPTRFIVCSELDKEALAWAIANRRRPNISYVNRHLERADGPFDIVVAVDVIEHIGDFRGFLESCVRLGPRLLVTTPNKGRAVGSVTTGPPEYYLHVREWTAGEFYWVLRTFYRSVTLYSMPDEFAPIIIPVKIDTGLTPLIALCADPVGHSRSGGMLR